MRKVIGMTDKQFDSVLEMFKATAETNPQALVPLIDRMQSKFHPIPSKTGQNKKPTGNASQP